MLNLSRRAFAHASLAAGTVALMGCRTDAVSDAAQNGEAANEEVIAMAQTGMTRAVPTRYFQPADTAGTVTTITYQTPDRNENGEAVEKSALVYLPFGYDEGEGHYDICYFMHGWGGHEGEYFELANIKDMLDNMIVAGDIAPTIFASPTFYTPASGGDFGGSESALRVFPKGQIGWLNRL